MASPWAPAPTRQLPVDRPWLGMAMLAAVPVLSLILVRLFWSGSSLWFLTVGIILLGTAAIVFLARRTQDQEYAHQTLAPETAKLPLILTGLGVLFLAMLILPNFAGGDSTPEGAPALGQSQPPLGAGAISDTAGISQPPVQQPAILPAPQDAATAGEQTYLVQSGDTLWDIAVLFDTTVSAIVAANDLEDETALTIDQELIIPAAGAAEEDETVTEPVETLP